MMLKPQIRLRRIAAFPLGFNGQFDITFLQWMFRTLLVFTLSVSLIVTQVLWSAMAAAAGPYNALPASVTSDNLDGSSVTTASLQPSGAENPSIVDLLSGKVKFSQPLTALSDVGPGFNIDMLYSSPTPGSLESASAATVRANAGNGWSVPALNQRIVRQHSSDANDQHDRFFLQDGERSVELFPIGQTMFKDRRLKISFTTTEGDSSIINWYRNDSLPNPENIRAGSKDEYLPSYWEVINKYGEISRYGDYKSKSSILANRAISPYDIATANKQKTSVADLSGGEKSAALCALISAGRPDSCHFLAVELSSQPEDSNSFGKIIIETAWNLAEREDPITGMATILSYACSFDVNRTNASSTCLLYQVASAGGNVVSFNYQTPTMASRPDDPLCSGTLQGTDHTAKEVMPSSQEILLTALDVFAVSARARAKKTIRKLGSTAISYCPLSSGKNMENVAYLPAAVRFFTASNGEATLSEPATLFDYYTTGNDADENAAQYGALKSITNPYGQRISISYQRNLIDLQTAFLGESNHAFWENPNKPTEDYTVASVSVDSGYQSSSLFYDYNSGKPNSPIKYTALNGHSIIYPSVKIIYGDVRPQAAVSYIEADFYAGDMRKTVPEIFTLKDAENGARPKNSALTETLLNAARGLPYETRVGIRDADGSESIHWQVSTTYLALHVSQHDSEGKAVVTKRAILPYEQKDVRYELHGGKDSTTSATTVKVHTYDNYFQSLSNSTTTTQFNHGSEDGKPTIGNQDISQLTITEYILRAIFVKEYAPHLLNQNRLNEVYARITTAKNESSPEVIKKATINGFSSFNSPVAEQHGPLISNISYELRLGENWQSPVQFLLDYPPTKVVEDEKWMADSEIIRRELTTGYPIASRLATGETYKTLSAYENRNDPSLSYPRRYEYAHFALGKDEGQSSNDDVPATYIGFEKYEDIAFDELINVLPSCSSHALGISVSGGVLTQGPDANSGNRYCDRSVKTTAGSKSRPLAVSLNSNFAPKKTQPYVVSAWVRPVKGGVCNILPDADLLDEAVRRSTTSDHYAKTLVAEPDDEKWFYIEATTPNGADMAPGSTLLTCEGAVDDIRVSPLGSKFNAVVYDTDISSSGYGLPIASHADNGMISRALYGDDGKKVAEMLQDIDKPQCALSSPNCRSLHTLTDLPIASGMSRWEGHNRPAPDFRASFNPAIPNHEYSGIEARGTNTAAYFKEILGSQKVTIRNSDKFFVRFDTKTLGEKGVSLTLGPTGSDTPSKLDIQFDRELIVKLNGKSMALPPGKRVAPEEFLIAVHNALSGNPALIILADGNLIVSHFPPAKGVSDSTSDVAVMLTGDELRQVIFAPWAGTVTASYTDGTGRVIEDHALSGFLGPDNVFHFTDVAHANWYGGDGQQKLVSKPVEYTAPASQDASVPKHRKFSPGYPIGSQKLIPNLLQFRGVKYATNPSRTQASPTPIRNFGAIDWSRLTLFAKTENLLSFDIAFDPKTGDGEDLHYAIQFGTSKASPAVKGAMSRISKSEQNLAWQHVSVSVDSHKTGKETLIRVEDKSGDIALGNVYIRNLQWNGVDSIQFANNHAGDDRDFRKNHTYTNGIPTVKVDQKSSLFAFSGLQDSLLMVGLNSSDLYQFYSGKNPGQLWFSNTDRDAVFAFANIDHRVNATSPGTSGQSSTALLSPYKEMEQNQPPSGFRYRDHESVFPQGNGLLSFTLEDGLGNPVISGKSSHSPNDQITKNTMKFDGFVYDLMKKSQIADSVGTAAPIGSYQETRLPLWYQENHKSSELASAQTIHNTTYDLLGHWTSQQRTDSEDHSIFTDRIGRTRIIVRAPGFDQNIKERAPYQIVSYFKRDAYGRLIESGRLKNVNYTALQWMSTTADSAFDDSKLLGLKSCIVAQKKYDSYSDVPLYAKSSGSNSQAKNLSADTRLQSSLLNGRGLSIAEIQYSRTVSENEDGWNQNALTDDGCNNQKNDTEAGLGNYVLTTEIYDQYGRPLHDFTNIVTVDDRGLRNGSLYLKSHQFDSDGNYIRVFYPSDADGNSGDFSITAQKDRLDRISSLTKTIGGQSSQLWKVADFRFGEPVSEIYAMGTDKNKDQTYVTKEVKYNFQNMPVAITQKDQDGKLLLLEEFGYLSDLGTPGTQAHRACHDLNLTQYSYNLIAWKRLSGDAWFDKDAVSDLQSNSDERCYGYDGDGQLTKIVRVLNEEKNTRSDLLIETFQYDENGNIVQKHSRKLVALNEANTPEYLCESRLFELDNDGNSIAQASYNSGVCSNNSGDTSNSGDNPGNPGFERDNTDRKSNFSYDTRYGTLNTFATPDIDKVVITRDADGIRPVNVAFQSRDAEGSFKFQDGPDGRAVEIKTVGETQTSRHFVWAGFIRPIAEFQSNAKNTSVTYSLPGGGQYNAETGMTYFPVKDYLNSTRGILQQGEIVAKYDYDITGKPTVTDSCYGTCEVGQYEYLYQGQRFLEFGADKQNTLAGLYAFPARLYDPDQMRWASLDEAFDSISPYTAMANNWVNFTDPDGNVVTFWIAVGLAGFTGITLAVGALFRNSSSTNMALTTIRALNAAQLHYKGFLIIHIVREGLIAFGPRPQFDRVLHILQVPVNMMLLLTFLLMTKNWVTGGRPSVTGTTPRYNRGSWRQIAGVILSKTAWQAVIGYASYRGIGAQAVITVYPALVLGELSYMLAAHQFRIRQRNDFWADPDVPASIASVMNSRRASFLYGMSGATVSTLVLGGMWQGYGNPPPTRYWGHRQGLVSGQAGIAWNALTMIVVEGIIYIFWIGTQEALYRILVIRHRNSFPRDPIPIPMPVDELNLEDFVPATRLQIETQPFQEDDE
ncbi:RHS repeat-associated core domain-containing protein [uncultured Sneathiella sp.]|uniref:RHS repeat domain-containing protein n=1 Tax=uncultured Sneathiella sp. TaxID=879315 RepID=UPI002597D287|nr:RHS repeat-associated core domain-containing protein [uncultured Sneathiella sp.]